MHSENCSGPDGYNLSFYQHFLSLCSDDTVVKDDCFWLDTGHLLTNLNFTNIMFIPKGNIQTTMKDDIHIALCNILYKLISKVFAN